MRNTKADRRSERTRQLLNAALIELMLEQRYDAITVQDIIDRANIGRSTFYAHYLDKEDLLVSGFTRVLDTLSQEQHQIGAGEHQALPSLAQFFQHVQDHHQLYKALVRGGGIDRLFKKKPPAHAPKYRAASHDADTGRAIAGRPAAAGGRLSVRRDSQHAYVVARQRDALHARAHGHAVSTTGATWHRKPRFKLW